jgi:hypothetical protein
MAEKKPIERCRVRIVESKKDVWGLEVEGCENVLNRIKNELGPYGRKYLFDRIKKVENIPETGTGSKLPEES